MKKETFTFRVEFELEGNDCRVTENGESSLGHDENGIVSSTSMRICILRWLMNRTKGVLDVLPQEVADAVFENIEIDSAAFGRSVQ
jgi:hypothetical protein